MHTENIQAEYSENLVCTCMWNSGISNLGGDMCRSWMRGKPEAEGMAVKDFPCTKFSTEDLVVMTPKAAQRCCCWICWASLKPLSRVESIHSGRGIILQQSFQYSGAERPALHYSGWNVCLGAYSGHNVWFPPSNQLTQAWNAQLRQAKRLGCLRNCSLS